MNRSKWVILGMLLLAVTAAAASISYQHWLTREANAFWSPGGARLMMEAPRVEVLRLAPLGVQSSAGPQETLTIGSGSYAIVARHDVSGAAGLPHVRRGLAEDTNFAWDAKPPTLPPVWKFAIEFRDGPRQLVVAFDPASHRLGRGDTGTTVAIARLATGWEEFFSEEFPDPAPLGRTDR